MTCSSSDELPQEQLNKAGIVRGHAYSLLSVCELEFEGQVFKLVKLRNPWGDGEWTGDWNDNDERFNRLSKEQIELLKFTKEKDGTFFIEYKDFRQYFSNF